MSRNYIQKLAIKILGIPPMPIMVMKKKILALKFMTNQ
jgi:hypothetical protein